MTSGSATAPPEPTPEMRRERMTPEQTEAVRMERLALAELMQAKILRAAYSERQLEEVMVDFWFNHFNVFAGKGQVARLPHRVRARRDPAARARQVPRPAAATAESPAMLFYLDNWQSAAPAGAVTAAPRRRATPRHPNRTPNGAGMPGSNGQVGGRRRGRACCRCRQRRRTRSPTRTSSAPRPERELRARADGAAHARRRRRLHAEGRAGSRARVHRLDDRQPAPGRRLPVRAADARRRREDRARPEDQGGRRQAGRRARCSTSSRSTRRPRGSSRPSWRAASSPTTPPAALVERAAQRFRETDGDIREVVRTIVTSPEFFAAEAYRAKVKTPVRVRRQRGARDRRRRRRTRLPLVQAVRDARHAALHVPAADRLRRQGRGVGEHRARCSNRMNFAVHADVGPAARRPAVRRRRSRSNAAGRSRAGRRRLDVDRGDDRQGDAPSRRRWRSCSALRNSREGRRP